MATASSMPASVASTARRPRWFPPKEPPGALPTIPGRAPPGQRVDPYLNPDLDTEIETWQTKPTVVPIGPASRPIPLLAVTHNLNWEGAPRIELEIVRRLHASGSIRPEVLSPCDGPLRR